MLRRGGVRMQGPVKQRADESRNGTEGVSNGDRKRMREGKHSVHVARRQDERLTGRENKHTEGVATEQCVKIILSIQLGIWL